MKPRATGLALVALVLVLGLGVELPRAAAVTSDAERREEIAEELERLEEQVDEAVSTEAGALAELQVTRRAKGQLDVDLIGLDRRITAAEADVAASEADVAAADAVRRRATSRLVAARARVDESERVLRDQAVSRFMRFGVQTSTLDVFLGADDLKALHEAAAFVDVVASSQAEVVRHHRRLQADTSELEARAAEATVEAGRRREEVAAGKRELEAARSEQALALAELGSEERREEGLVATIRSTRGEYEQRIAALEAESQAITVLLQQRQADQAVAPPPPAPGRGAVAAEPSARRAGGDDTNGAGSRSGTAAGDDDASDDERNSEAVTPARRATLAYPLANPVVTSGYGYRIHPIYGTRRLHAGVDLRGATGTTVLAAGDGTVVFAGPRGGYGNAVIIDHGGSVATLYAHQSRLAVSAGAAVNRGQAIGAVGSTGLSSGPHLHFEVRLSGTPVDPLNYL